jgi:hypothetical protein
MRHNSGSRGQEHENKSRGYARKAAAVLAASFAVGGVVGYEAHDKPVASAKQELAAKQDLSRAAKEASRSILDNLDTYPDLNGARISKRGIGNVSNDNTFIYATDFYIPAMAARYDAKDRELIFLTSSNYDENWTSYATIVRFNVGADNPIVSKKGNLGTDDFREALAANGSIELGSVYAAANSVDAQNLRSQGLIVDRQSSSLLQAGSSINNIHSNNETGTPLTNPDKLANVSGELIHLLAENSFNARQDLAG